MKKIKISKILCNIFLISTLIVPTVPVYADRTQVDQGSSADMNNQQNNPGSSSNGNSNSNNKKNPTGGGSSGSSSPVIKDWGDSASNPVVSYVTKENLTMISNGVNEITNQQNGIIEYKYNSPSGETEYRKIYYPVDTRSTTYNTVNEYIVEKYFDVYKWEITAPSEDTNARYQETSTGNLRYTFNYVGDYKFVCTPREYIKKSHTVTTKTDMYVIYANGTQALKSSTVDSVQRTYPETRKWRTDLTKTWQYYVTPEEIGEHNIPDDVENVEDIDIDVQLIR